jgi:hypothetical protein
MMPGDRIDPETGAVVRPGCMTAAEFRTWDERQRERVRAWSFGPEPEPAGTFVMIRWLGWIRKAVKR